MSTPLNYSTVVSDLFTRFPELEEVYRRDFAYMGSEEPAPYMVFGSILIPALTTGLERDDRKTVVRLCGFLEDVSLAARSDLRLLGLMKVEVAEWLGSAASEERLAPSLGPETKRICNYVPGLATQRRELRAEAQRKNVFTRVASFVRRLQTASASDPVSIVSSTSTAVIGKEDSRRIRAQIRRVLLEVWDPIGIKDEPNAQDEYDAYIGRLYELLAANASDAELSGFLHWIAHDQMGFEEAKASDAQPTINALRSIPIQRQPI